MSITVFENPLLFKLSTDHTHYSFRINRIGLAEHVSYDAAVEDGSGLCQLAEAVNAHPFEPYWTDLTAFPQANCKDLLPQEFGGFNTGDYRIPALISKGEDGTPATDWRYVSYRVYSGVPILEELPCAYVGNDRDVQTLELKLADSVTGLAVYLEYVVFPRCDVIVRGLRVVNEGRQTVTLERVMSLQLDLPAGDYDSLSLVGYYGQERLPERRALGRGVLQLSSVRGISSHGVNPAFAVMEQEATEDHGRVWGFMLAYSGNFLGEIEVPQMRSPRVLLGIHPELFSWRLRPGESFTAPQAFMSFTDEGVGGMSRHFHDFFRSHWLPSRWALCQRPILINNWEATYFDFNEERLLAIARTAAPLGVDMLVLDDGWFGRRRDDTSSLGDWFVNADIIPDMAGMVRKINALGMKFGLWFEPEMVSENSGFFREHPEWVIQISGRGRSIGRHQMMLDMGNPEVVDAIFRQMKKLLETVHVEYIKWDCNRTMTECGSSCLSADRQGEVAHRFVLGTYSLYRKLLNAFPYLLIEGCAGGGGRFDAGILRYSPQIWCSDVSDACERMRIQMGTSLFYPCSAMGAHVSACPNHQTGRVTPFATRGNVALSGTFGYELDLAKLSKEEQDMVREQTALYHQLNPLVASGDLFRLEAPGRLDKVLCWSFISKDKTQGFVVLCRPQMRPYAAPLRIRLKGLRPEAYYQIDGNRLTGKALMSVGICVALEERDAASRILRVTMEK